MDDDSFAIGLVVGQLDTQKNADKIAGALTFIGLKALPGLNFNQLSELIKTIYQFGLKFDIDQVISNIDMIELFKPNETITTTLDSQLFSSVSNAISNDITFVDVKSTNIIATNITVVLS